MTEEKTLEAVAETVEGVTESVNEEGLVNKVVNVVKPNANYILVGGAIILAGFSAVKFGPKGIDWVKKHNPFKKKVTTETEEVIDNDVTTQA